MSKRTPEITMHCGRLLVILLLTLGAVSFAAQPQDGYFYGVEMEPIGSATMAQVEKEPAVALLFAIDKETAEITRQFDAWYQSADRPQVEIFAIAVNPQGLSRDVALVAIEQRNLRMPVFLADSDMLLGDDFRLLVLNNDSEAARFTTLDLAGVYAELQKIGITVSTPAPIPAAVTTPSPMPASIYPTPDAPPATSASDPAVTTSTVPETLILGGEGQSGEYINNLFGMRVQFPPDWKFQVAGKRDGAVAIPPGDLKMDMRIWSMPAPNMTSPQDYVDQRLKSIAEQNRTAVKVERHVRVLNETRDSVDVTYTYTELINAQSPDDGGVVSRGRMLVFLHEGHIKAAGVSAPGGQFMAAFPLVDSFTRSFEVFSSDISPTPEYQEPDII